jgi:succinate dehydrogenase/fumarate reductase flavoprotein subunit
MKRRDSGITEMAADVPVVGGGPAATWASVSAAQARARVILVDKGYVGASGCGARHPDPTTLSSRGRDIE